MHICSCTYFICVRNYVGPGGWTLVTTPWQLAEHCLGFKVLRVGAHSFHAAIDTSSTPCRSHLAWTLRTKPTPKAHGHPLGLSFLRCRVQFHALGFQMPSLEKTSSQHKLLRAISPLYITFSKYWHGMSWLFWCSDKYAGIGSDMQSGTKENMQSDACSDRVTCNWTHCFEYERTMIYLFLTS